jgi:AcrR family transcriptional regulator
MSKRASEVENPPLSLVERKQRAARSRIIEAADALFAERGFDSVSVTDIAERAEVGRTTFFRHFGDKTEVVFAKEQAMFDAIADETSAVWTPTQSVESLAGAVSALQPLVIRLCEKATADPSAYERHMQLLDAHEELRAREALKNRYISKELARGGTACTGLLLQRPDPGDFPQRARHRDARRIPQHACDEFGARRSLRRDLHDRSTGRIDDTPHLVRRHTDRVTKPPVIGIDGDGRTQSLTPKSPSPCFVRTSYASA